MLCCQRQHFFSNELFRWIALDSQIDSDIVLLCRKLMYDYASELNELIASVHCLHPLLAHVLFNETRSHPPFVNLGHL